MKIIYVAECFKMLIYWLKGTDFRNRVCFEQFIHIRTYLTGILLSNVFLNYNFSLKSNIYFHFVKILNSFDVKKSG